MYVGVGDRHPNLVQNKIIQFNRIKIYVWEDKSLTEDAMTWYIEIRRFILHTCAYLCPLSGKGNLISQVTGTRGNPCELRSSSYTQNAH